MATTRRQAAAPVTMGPRQDLPAPRDAPFGAVAFGLMVVCTMLLAVLSLVGDGADGADDARVRIVLSTHAALTAAFALVAVPRVPQDRAYHDFADARRACCMPNALNVLSNVPFLAVGAAGLAAPTSYDGQPAWFVFYAAVAAVSLGSAYYHWRPTNATLEWDRLPMAVAFMALLGMVLNDRLGVGTWAMLPLLTAGVGSVVYWREHDDLRPYALVQFYTVLVILALCALRPASSPLLSTGRLMASLACYALAKLLEHADRGVYRATCRAVSGHTLKHLVAALAVACLLPAP